MNIEQLMRIQNNKPSILTKNDKNSINDALSRHPFMIHRRNYHKFIILNGALLKKQRVLSSIVRFCLPHSLTPVKYTCNENNDGHSHFISSNCWTAVRALCMSDLTVTIPETNTQFEVVIHLDFLLGDDERSPVKAPVDILWQTLKMKKIDSGYIMNCNNFELNPDLDDCYFPLWSQHYQRMLVDVTKNMISLTHLNLSHNQIESLAGFAKLGSPNLEELDLSHNIINWPELIPIHPLKLKRLWLNGNPLCSGVSLTEYINRIKAMYPNLERLDGENIYNSDMGFIVKNSFVDKSAYHFVDHFLHHYFKWFLMPEGRKSMIHMYHSKATLSISSNIRSSPENLTMTFFSDLSRNILKITNYAKACDSFKVDRSLIEFYLTAFPYVELDPTSTSVDVPYYVENKVIQVCVNGVFRDRSQFVYWMSFTFMLQALNDTSLREWKIINQLISILPGSPEQSKRAFVKQVRTIDTSEFELTKSEILSQFKELTSLKTPWCEHFLESTRWDMESALQSFVDQYKGDFVEEDAFISL